MRYWLKRIPAFVTAFGLGIFAASLFHTISTEPNIAPLQLTAANDAPSNHRIIEGRIVAIHRYSGGPGWPNIDTEQIDPASATRPAIVLTRPPADATEAARKNKTTGTVLLSAVLSGSGVVRDVVAEWKLPDGLTEQARKAAAQMEFKPALVSGRPVDQRILIQYDFMRISK